MRSARLPPVGLVELLRAAPGDRQRVPTVPGVNSGDLNDLADVLSKNPATAEFAASAKEKAFEQVRRHADRADAPAGVLALAAAVAGLLVYWTPAIWGLALPISSIAMVLGLIGLLSNSPPTSARIMALLGLAIGIVTTVIVAVHLIQLPAGR